MRDEVRIWLIPTTSDSIAEASVLTAAELQRAERFRLPKIRHRFIRVRSALKEILGRQLECDPLEIRFAIGEHGKPSVSHPASSLHFNVSDSNELAVIAVTTAGPIGVDIEWMRTNVSDEAIAKRHFTTREQQWLSSQPEVERKKAFFRLWVLKEAVMKADGRGLAMGLVNAEIDFGSGTPILASKEWQLQELQLVEGYAAALACRVQCRLLIMDSYNTAG